MLQFLRQNLGANDSLLAGVKKRLLETVGEFMRERPSHVATYLPQINDTCIRTFGGDANSLVKEAALQLLVQIIDHYPLAVLSKFLAPSELVARLLDEIKLRRPRPSVKGALWALVGLCHKKFGEGVRNYLLES